MEDSSFDYGRAEEYYKSGNFELARKLFEVGLQEGDTTILIYLSAISLIQGNGSAGNRYLKQAIQKYDYRAYYRLGVAFEQVGYLKKAQWSLHVASKCGVIEADNLLGFIAYNQGKENLAIYYFRIAADRGLQSAQYNVGVCYDNKDNLVMAKKYYKRAAKSGHSPAQSALGMMYINENKFLKAKKHCKAAAKNGCVNSLYNLGVIYEKRGFREKAIACYGKAAAKD